MPSLLVVAPTAETACIRDVLAPSGLASDARFVATIEAGLAALHEKLWSAVILALPRAATEIPIPIDLFVDGAHTAPLIVVAPTIGEEAAAHLVRHGVADVVSYARIARLPEVVGREMRSTSKLASRLQNSRTAYAWLASIVNNVPVGIVYHNAAGEIVLCNETALTLLGLTESELLGITSLDPRWNVIHDDGQPFPGGDHPSLRAIDTKQPVHDVIMGVYRPKQDDRIWLRVDATPVFDAEEQLQHVVVVFADVTERRKMEAKLRLSEARVRSAFEHSGTGMLVVSPDGTIIQGNTTACQMLGLTRETVIGKTMSEVTHPDDVETTRIAIYTLITQKLKSISFEKRYVQPSGHVIWASSAIDVVFDRENRPVHFVVAIQDITARKEAEAERERLHAQLLQAQKMEALGILAGGVAHDFNNILAAVLCSADVLMQDLRRVTDAGEMPEIVYEIQTAAQRGADLVKQILTFSRRASQRKTPMKLAAIAYETLGLLRKTVPQNVEIHSTIGPSPTVFADATQIQQVLTNLCTNAFHAMEPRGGVLSVSLDACAVNADLAKVVPGLREGSYARFRVTDTGPGMDEKTLGRIFEPFFTTKGVGKGTGLGMAVVHGIVMGHDGAIRVQSKIGQGTTVEVWLPGRDSEPRFTAIDTKPIERGHAEHILLVDDENGLARILGRLLQGLGYTVTAEQESAIALEIFEKNPDQFHVALLDLHMPAPDGIEVARRLHALRPHLPIFIMSGYSDALGDTSPEELGVVGVLQKPIMRETLARELRSVLDRPVPR